MLTSLHLSLANMASSLSASASSSGSLPSSSPLSRLPVVLLPHICSFLSPKELLVTLAHTANTTRELLTPACFSFTKLTLTTRDLSVLACLSSSSSVSFHSRVLTECRLFFDLISRDINVQHVFASLGHFPSCKALTVNGAGCQLLDAELYALLHHPICRTCDEFEVHSFHRLGPDGDWQSQADIPVDGSEQQIGSGADSEAKKPLSWADVRFPSATHLFVQLFGYPEHTGGAAFLTAHTALLHLSINTMLVSVDEMTAIFQNSAALPQLTRFTMYEHEPGSGRAGDVTALLTALATTVVVASGRPRPVEWLDIDIPAPPGVFADAALMPALSSLQMQQASPNWLEEWTGSAELLSAFPLLRECRVATKENRKKGDELGAATDILLFVRSITSRPLELLDIRVGNPVKFTAAAIAELAHCHQLRELSISIGVWDRRARLDWTNAALFESFATIGSLPALRSFTLQQVNLSAELVVIIASAAPALEEFIVSDCEPSCHPAFVCAIVGGYCEQIEEFCIGDGHQHEWKNVQATDVTNAFQSATAAARRDAGYKPFTQLRRLDTMICWCTPPSVWHAMLSLLKYATRVQLVTSMASNDSLVTSALSHLPALKGLGAGVLYPQSFATSMMRKSGRSGRYRYLASKEVSSGESTECSGAATYFELIDTVEETRRGWPVMLRPQSRLLTAFQRSLTAAHQAVLARWAAGDFQAGDEKLTAAESPLETHPAEEGADTQFCPHPHLLYTRHVEREETAEENKEEGEAVGDEGSGSDEDMIATDAE